MKKSITKTYFDSNIITKEDESNAEMILKLLNKHGCNIIQTVLALDWNYTNEKGKRAAINIYTSKINDIKECDILVCEVTHPSPTISFEVFEALTLKKPTLLLHNENDYTSNIAFDGNPSKLLINETYNKNNLEEKITSFLKKAKSNKPISRFTVRLTQDSGNYLNFLKARMKMASKNDVVNKILEDMMNEDYDFIKNQQG